MVGERGTVAHAFFSYRGNVNFAVAVLRSATDRAGGNAASGFYGPLGWGRLPLAARRILTAARRYRFVCYGDCAGDAGLGNAQLPALHMWLFAANGPPASAAEISLNCCLIF